MNFSTDFSALYQRIEEKNPHLYPPDEPPNPTITSWIKKHTNDPLSYLQMQKMHGFINYFILSQRPILEFNHFSYYKTKLPIQLMPFLYKSYSIIDEHAEVIKKYIFSDFKHLTKEEAAQEFDLFQSVIRNPALLAREFEFDQSKKMQIYAAKIFIKSVLKASREVEDGSLGNILLTYYQKLFSENDKIKNKHILLSYGNPIITILHPVTPLQVIFSNMHTFVGHTTQTWITSFDGIKNQIIEIKSPSRKYIYDLIIQVLEESYLNKHLKPILDALAVIIKLEKGNILVSPEANLNLFFENQAYTGLYNGRHTIFCQSFYTQHKGYNPEALPTFFHEALHFIIKVIFRNNGDPTPYSNNYIIMQEKAECLDKLLFADRIHRSKLNIVSLTDIQKKIYFNFLNSLEKNEKYFPGGFDSSNPIHLKTMRTESIVKIIEGIAKKFSPQDIKKIHPNLWDDYIKRIHPLIIKFGEDKIKQHNLFSEDSSVKEGFEAF